MNITPISTNLNNISSPLGGNNAIKLLEKQKAQLQEQIQKTTESKMDDKTKQEKIKELRNQIQEIDMEIQQKRNEMLNQRQPENKASAEPNYEDSYDLSGMSHLIQANAAYSNAKTVKSTKNSLTGRGNVLKIEIKLDEGRSEAAGSDPTKGKRAELQNIESRERMLDKKAGKTLKAVHNEVKASQEEVKDKDNKDRDLKSSDAINQENADKEGIDYKSIDIKI